MWLILAVSVYPAILTTHIRLLEQRSQAVISAESSLSVYISDLHHTAVTLVKSTASCLKWEFTWVLCMTPSLETFLRGDCSKLEDDISEADTEEMEYGGYDLFAEGEEDDGA
jgi:hypothetical protein